MARRKSKAGRRRSPGSNGGGAPAAPKPRPEIVSWRGNMTALMQGLRDWSQTSYGEAIQKLRVMIEADDFEAGEGGYETADLIPAYKAMILERIKLERPMRIAVDSGNGVAGPIAPLIYRELGCEVIDHTGLAGPGRTLKHHRDGLPGLMQRPSVSEHVAVLGRGHDAMRRGLGWDGEQ